MITGDNFKCNFVNKNHLVLIFVIEICRVWLMRGGVGCYLIFMVRTVFPLCVRYVGETVRANGWSFCDKLEYVLAARWSWKHFLYLFQTTLFCWVLVVYKLVHKKIYKATTLATGLLSTENELLYCFATALWELIPVLTPSSKTAARCQYWLLIFFVTKQRPENP